MQNNYRKYFILFGAFFLFLQCSQEFELEDSLHPKVETYAPVEVTEQGAILEGEILTTGNEAILEHGFVYGQMSWPTIEEADKVSLGALDKPIKFQGTANHNLEKDKKYNVRAYARTTNHLVYGNQTSFISKGGAVTKLKSFFPAEGVVGDTVYLIGEGFSTASAQNSVSFNQALAMVVKASSDTLAVIVPKEVKAGENIITLKVGTFTLALENKFIVKDFVIHRFSPAILTFGDTLLLEGENFSRNKEYIEVAVLGTKAEIISAGIKLIKVVIPDTLSMISSPVSLSIAGRTQVADGTLRLNPPEIHSFSPRSVTRDTRITIEGKYFSPVREDNKVYINNTRLFSLDNSPTQLVFRVPSGIAPGQYPLVVEVLGQRIESSEVIEVIYPEITDVTPQEGTWNDEVTILGRNFGSGLEENIVRFGEIEASVVSASSEKVVVRVPNKLDVKSSTVSIQVKTVDNLVATAANPFLLLDPVISSFSPGEGKGGDIITINGQGFNPESNLVQFGQFTASIVSNTADQLQVQLPPNLIDGSEVLISVSVGELIANSSETFTLKGPWRKVAEFPGHLKAEPVAFAIVNSGYVGLGTENSLWKYDPPTDVWSERAPFNLSKTSKDMIAFVLDGKAYAGIGNVGWNKYSNRLSAYDPLTDSWSGEVASYPGDALEAAVSFSIGGKGYVATGNTNSGSGSRQLWLYEPNTNSWNNKADLPGESRSQSTAFTLNNKAYLIGGTSGYTRLSDVWVYDPATDNWQSRNAFPGEARSSAVAFNLNGKVYIMGGYGSAFNYLNDLWEYDEAADSWKKLGTFPGTARAAAAVFVIDGKAYIGLGETKDGNYTKYLKDFWEFDPAKM